ncbi:MAG: phasin family protein [Pseudomonadota bacterium]
MIGKGKDYYGDWFKMFDPNDVTKFFDPMRMFSAMDTRVNPFDLSGVYDANRKSFDAMVEANKAAATAYQDLLEKQMDMFNQLTAAARDQVNWIDETTGPEALTRRTEAYGVAVEKALVLMRKLAESARDANEEAYTSLKSQVTEAIDEVHKKSRPK